MAVAFDEYAVGSGEWRVSKLSLLKSGYFHRSFAEMLGV